MVRKLSATNHQITTRRRRISWPYSKGDFGSFDDTGIFFALVDAAVAVVDRHEDDDEDGRRRCCSSGGLSRPAEVIVHVTTKTNGDAMVVGLWDDSHGRGDGRCRLVAW